MKPNWMIVGALSGALGVGLAAWGAHGMQEVITEPDHQAWWRTGVRIQMWHAPVLLLTGWFGRPKGLQGPLVGVAGWLLALGTLLFSGCLYAMALGGPRWLGAVVPLGGLGLLLGWLCLAAAGRRGTVS